MVRCERTYVERDLTLDIAKGIGILLVVLGHIEGVAGNEPDIGWSSFLKKKIKMHWAGKLKNSFENLGLLSKSVIVVVGACYLIVISDYNIVDMSYNLYSHPFLAVTGAITGIVAVLSLSNIISKTKVFKNVLVLLGKNSMSIMIWHFVAFSLVSIMQIKMQGLSLAAFKPVKCYNPSSFWWSIYLIAGLTIPLAFSYLFSLIKDRSSLMSNTCREKSL